MPPESSNTTEAPSLFDGLTEFARGPFEYYLIVCERYGNLRTKAGTKPIYPHLAFSVTIDGLFYKFLHSYLPQTGAGELSSAAKWYEFCLICIPSYVCSYYKVGTPEEVDLELIKENINKLVDELVEPLSKALNRSSENQQARRRTRGSMSRLVFDDVIPAVWLRKIHSGAT